jgi:WD40 repeat protein
VDSWDAATGDKLRALNLPAGAPCKLRIPGGRAVKYSCVAFSPDGRHLAAATYGVTVWDNQTGREVLSIPLPVRDVLTRLVYSPDGHRLVGVLNKKEIRAWEAGSGKEVLRIAVHGGLVQDVACSPDGRRLASAGGDGSVKLWDAITGRELLTARKHLGSVTGVAFSPDGKRLASAGLDGFVRVQGSATGGPVFGLYGPIDDRRGLQNPQVAFSPDGKLLGSSGWAPGTVKVLDSHTGLELEALRGHTAPTRALAFAPDGKRLATAGLDGAVKVWDLTAGQQAQTLVAPASGRFAALAFSPDRRYIALGILHWATIKDRVFEVKVLDASTGAEVGAIRQPGEGDRLRFSADGRRLAFRIRQRQEHTVRIVEVPGGRELYTLKGGPTGTIAHFDYAPDGKRVAAALIAKEGHLVKVWDVETGRELLSLPKQTHPLNAIVFSPGGRRLGTAGEDYTVRLWDAASGREIRALRGHPSGVTGVAFSPTTGHLACSSADGTVKLWDPDTGQAVKVLRGPGTRVGGLAYSPDGQRLACGDYAGSVMVWDVPTGWELLSLRTEQGGPGEVAFTPDGARLACRGVRSVRIWDGTAWGQKAAAPLKMNAQAAEKR